MLELIAAMTLMEKVFLTCALSGTVIFFIRMGLMFIGLTGAGSDADGVHQVDGDVADDVADVAVDTDGVDVAGYAEAGHDGGDSDVSFQYISVQGLTAFFMMFGWVGLAMIRDSKMPEWSALLVGALAGIITVWIVARLFAFAASLQSDGTARLKTAMGSGGCVYLRIPAEGTGQVQVEVDGRLRIYDAVSSKKEEIKTGEQITVVWIQDNGVLVVDKDTREEGGRLCGQ